MKKTMLLLMTFMAIGAGANPIYPLRIYKSQTSDKYLVVLSTRRDWLDRTDKESVRESSYNLRQVGILWGDTNRMQRFQGNEVHLSRNGEGSPWTIKLWQRVAEGETTIFSLPSKWVENEKAFVRGVKDGRIEWTEFLVEVDSSDVMYQTMHQGAKLGYLAAFAAGQLNSDEQVQQCEQLASGKITDAAGNEVLMSTPTRLQ